ncbi:MAG: F0F1 ATP synthase subunit delta [Bacteroidota bacterium]
MNESHIAIRYAKALFELAKEKNILDRVYKDILLVKNTLSENAGLKNILKNPVIPESGKQKILYAIFSSHVAVESLRFLDIILKNKRETYIESISRDFINAYKNEKGIKTVRLTTAVAVSEEVKQELGGMVAKTLQCTTEFETEINPDIIGGFILRIQDMQYNASVREQLNKIRQSLTKI